MKISINVSIWCIKICWTTIIINNFIGFLVVSFILFASSHRFLKFTRISNCIHLRDKLIQVTFILVLQWVVNLSLCSFYIDVLVCIITCGGIVFLSLNKWWRSLLSVHKYTLCLGRFHSCKQLISFLLDSLLLILIII